MVHHATKLNEVIAAAKGVPLSRAHITYGGYYDGLWGQWYRAVMELLDSTNGSTMLHKILLWLYHIVSFVNKIIMRDGVL